MKCVIDDYKSGTGLRKLASKYHMDWSTVRDIITSAGLEIRQRSITKCNPILAKQLYESGRSSGYIAKQFGCAPRTVRSCLIKHGIQLRNAEHCNRTYPIKLHDVGNLATELGSYWFGFHLADSYLNPGRYRLTCNIAKRDIQHLYLFSRDLHSNIQPKVSTVTCNGKKYKRASIRVDSKTLYTTYLDNGWGDYKQGKPLKITPTTHMLRGIWDGDGIVTNSRKYLRMGVCAVTESLLLWIAEHLQFAVRQSGRSLNLNSCNKNNSIFAMCWTGRPALAIAETLYLNQQRCLQRKLCKISSYIF